VSLERSPLSLGSTIDELLGRKRSGSGLKSREYDRKGSVTLTTWHPLSAKDGTSCGRSVGIVLSWTQATEFSLVCK
jgi:hypothetical protein